MILKIAVASRVETEYYLTLDTDIFLTRQLNAENFREQGKLVYQREQTATHRSWWASSARVLGYEPKRVLAEGRAMGVTPEYLVAEACRGLQKEIAQLHGTRDWARWLMESRMSKKKLPNKVVRFLVKSLPWSAPLLPGKRLAQVRTCDWTEYTLYWTYLHKHGLIGRYYADGERQVYGNCVWGETEMKGRELEELLEATFKDNALYHFSVVQSSIKHLDQARLAGLIARYLD